MIHLGAHENSLTSDMLIDWMFAVEESRWDSLHALTPWILMKTLWCWHCYIPTEWVGQTLDLRSCLPPPHYWWPFPSPHNVHIFLFSFFLSYFIIFSSFFPLPWLRVEPQDLTELSGCHSVKEAGNQVLSCWLPRCCKGPGPSCARNHNEDHSLQ